MSNQTIADLEQQLQHGEAVNPDGFPPVHLWHPGSCGAMDLRIKRDGSWWYQGSPIQRQAMVKLFARILRREENGDYVLVTPVEKIRIFVDDAPLLVNQAYQQWQDAMPVIFMETSTGDTFRLDATHALWVNTDPVTQEPSPYVHVRAHLHALIGRNVFYNLVDWAIPVQHLPTGRQELILESAGEQFSLGFCDEV